jgi:hypothetical protein
VVHIPPPKNSSAASGHPTGTVFNYDTTGFLISGKAPVFMFVTTDETISGWNPGVNPTNAVNAIDRSGKAEYTGCTLATNNAGTFLYIANFKSGGIEVYSSTWHPIFLSWWAIRAFRAILLLSMCKMWAEIWL